MCVWRGFSWDRASRRLVSAVARHWQKVFMAIDHAMLSPHSTLRPVTRSKLSRMRGKTWGWNSASPLQRSTRVMFPPLPLNSVTGSEWCRIRSIYILNGRVPVRSNATSIKQTRVHRVITTSDQSAHSLRLSHANSGTQRRVPSANKS